MNVNAGRWGEGALVRSKAARQCGGLRRGFDMFLKIIIFAPFPLSRKVGPPWCAGQGEPADQSSRLTGENRKAFGEVGIEVSAALDLESPGQSANERECGALGGGRRLSGRGPLRGAWAAQGIGYVIEDNHFFSVVAFEEARPFLAPGHRRTTGSGLATHRGERRSRRETLPVRPLRALRGEIICACLRSPPRTQSPPGDLLSSSRSALLALEPFCPGFAYRCRRDTD
jgi:hypothetical protein